MRHFVQVFYPILLRGIGAIGLFLLVIFAIFTLSGSDTRLFVHPLSILALTVLVVSSVGLALFQRRMPDCIIRPHRPVHLAALIPGCLVAASFTPVAAMIALIATGVPSEILRPIAVGTALLFIALYLIAGLCGLILSLSPLSPPQRRSTPNGAMRTA